MTNHLLSSFWAGFVYAAIIFFVLGAIVMSLFFSNREKQDKEIEQPIAGDGIMGEVL